MTGVGIQKLRKKQAYGDWAIPELVKQLQDQATSTVLEAKVLRATAPEQLDVELALQYPEKQMAVQLARWTAVAGAPAQLF